MQTQWPVACIDMTHPNKPVKHLERTRSPFGTTVPEAELRNLNVLIINRVRIRGCGKVTGMRSGTDKKSTTLRLEII